MNSPSRGPAVYSPGPIMLERGNGSRVWDADGNEYVDFMMSFGALIQGHAHPTLVKTVSNAMSEGSHFAAATSAEVEAAERFRRMVPSAEVVRFTNSGSEATMLALRLARAHTGRRKFLKFEGHYHGWYDPFLLNAHSHPLEQLGPIENPARIPDSEGIPASTFDDVVLSPWNDVAALEAVLTRHGHELAAVITEPIMANMGCILPQDGYLERMRELTHDCGALLILDEVVTGFRYAPGGCQEYYGIEPDLSTFGKALGAGFPVGAVTGQRSILERMGWGEHMVLHYGTFNGHRLTMKVIAANLDMLSCRQYLSTAAQGWQCRHCGTTGSISAARRERCGTRFRTDVPDLLHGARPHSRLSRLLQVRGYCTLFAFCAPPARTRNLYDAFQRSALDYFNGAHGS